MHSHRLFADRVSAVPAPYRRAAGRRGKSGLFEPHKITQWFHFCGQTYSGAENCIKLSKLWSTNPLQAVDEGRTHLCHCCKILPLHSVRWTGLHPASLDPGSSSSPDHLHQWNLMNPILTGIQRILCCWKAQRPEPRDSFLSATPKWSGK